MVWAAKSTAPATFNLATAFEALVTGDANWAWLIDYLPYVTNDHWVTADFCARGPLLAPDLSPMLGASPPDRSPLAIMAKIATVTASVGLAAGERVFGAFCEMPGTPGVMSWSTPVCGSFDSVAAGGGWVLLATDPGAPWDSLRVVSALSDTGTHPVTVGTGTAAAALRAVGTFGVGATGTPYESGGAAPAGDTSVWMAASGGGAYNGTVCVQFGKLGGGTPHTPTPQIEPAGGLSPLQTVDPTLAGIAQECERLELKLETLLAMVESIAGATLDLGGPVDDPADLPVDDPAPIGDAVGAVFTLSGVPASRSLDFGVPQNLIKMGRVNLGTATSWYPSIWITHTPFIVQPFPPGTKRVTVSDLPPGTTVQMALIRPVK